MQNFHSKIFVLKSVFDRMKLLRIRTNIRCQFGGGSKTNFSTADNMSMAAIAVHGRASFVGYNFSLALLGARPSAFGFLKVISNHTVQVRITGSLRYMATTLCGRKRFFDLDHGSLPAYTPKSTTRPMGLNKFLAQLRISKTVHRPLINGPHHQWFRYGYAACEDKLQCGRQALQGNHIPV